MPLSIVKELSRQFSCFLIMSIELIEENISVIIKNNFCEITRGYPP